MNLPERLGLLDLNPLSVFEGGNVTMMRENIAMVLDIAKYRIGESNVIFTLLTPPAHGTLSLDLLINGRETTFTLHDVSENKVTNLTSIKNCSKHNFPQTSIQSESFSIVAC